MAKLFGREYTRAELERRAGRISQFAGVREYRIDGGAADGVAAVDVYTGSGFQFTVLLGRGMDISHASYRGTPLAWISPAGEVSAHAYEPAGQGWARTFAGGLLTTCGMSHAQQPADEDGVHYGMHGRASTLIAENVAAGCHWDGDEYRILVKGRTREAAFGHPQFELVRSISTRLGASQMRIEDAVTNVGHRPATHMYLYHMNVGHPVLGVGAELVATVEGFRVRTGQEADAADDPFHFGPPVGGYEQKVFSHYPVADEDGYAHAALINDSLDSGPLGVSFCFATATFPYLNEWKLLAPGEYVVGIEPNNSGILGRVAARAAGELVVLEPGQSVNYDTEIGVLDGAPAIGAFRARVAGILGRD